MTPVELAGPDRNLELFGVRLIGFDASTLRKLMLTVAFCIAVYVLAASLRALVRLVLRGRDDLHAKFLSQQAVSLVSSVLLVIVLVSIWFNNPGRLASTAALITAGLAVALQKFVMSLVGYFAILRGNTFRVGDRISMGGVRGDVIALGYIRTTIMEMGQPPAVQDAEPAMWVEARQYTGRIVTVTNDKIFDEPVYNFNREFPFLFEEMKLPVKYTGDRVAAEQILLDVAGRHTVDARQLGEEQLKELRRRYFLRSAEVGPRVYYRFTDNWIELTVRFLVAEDGIRAVKDAMSREILDALEEKKIEVASSSIEVVGLPELTVRIAEPAKS